MIPRNLAQPPSNLRACLNSTLLHLTSRYSVQILSPLNPIHVLQFQASINKLGWLHTLDVGDCQYKYSYVPMAKWRLHPLLRIGCSRSLNKNILSWCESRVNTMTKNPELLLGVRRALMLRNRGSSILHERISIMDSKSLTALLKFDILHSDRDGLIGLNQGGQNMIDSLQPTTTEQRIFQTEEAIPCQSSMHHHHTMTATGTSRHCEEPLLAWYTFLWTCFPSSSKDRQK